MMDLLRKQMKYIKTGNLFLCHFIVGMTISVMGPCLLDLQQMVHTDTQHISVLYIVKSIGGILGSIIIGVLLDLTKFKQVVLMAGNFFIAVTMFGTPWIRSADVLFFTMFVNGFFLFALETGSTVICLDLWGIDSSPILQGLYFAFNVGSLIAPLITAPFLENVTQLSENLDNTTFSIEELINSTASFSAHSTNIIPSLDVIPRIIYPFSITGIIAFLAGVLCLGACIISPTENECTKDYSNIDKSKRDFLFMFFISIFTFLIFVVVAGAEIGYAQTVTTFSAKGKLHLSTRQGSYITSAYWAALILSSFACVYLSMKITSLKLLVGDLCILAVASVILLFLILNELTLYLASVIFGVGIASVHGLVLAWLNLHISISGKLSAISTVGCAIGEMILPFTIVYFTDTVPEMFSFSITASVVLLMIFISLLNCLFEKK